jgi:hypothetical protein
LDRSLSTPAYKLLVRQFRDYRIYGVVQLIMAGLCGASYLFVFGGFSFIYLFLYFYFFTSWWMTSAPPRQPTKSDHPLRIPHQASAALA